MVLEGSSLILLTVVPPFAAFLYALVAALFLTFFGECRCTQYLVPHVVPCLSHLVATVAVVLVVSTSTISNNNNNNNNVVWLSILAFVNGILSVHWIRSTRIHIVEGGPGPQSLLSSLSSSSSSSLKGKVVVVTGANSGIGKETARALAALGATVVMACRSVERAQEARRECIESIRLLQQQQDEPPKMDILSLDLSSFASVRAAAAELNRRYDRIHILINNAGIMMGQQVMTAGDGYELVMQANHLGHYLFTRLLLEHYQLLSPPQQQQKDDDEDDDISRILILSSSTYVYADRIALEDLFCQKGKRQFSLFGQYAQSKLANLLFANELARRYQQHPAGKSNGKGGGKGKQPGIFVASIHPGMVRTDVVRNMPWYLYYPNSFFASFIQVLQKTPAQGAWNTLYLATTAATTNPSTSTSSITYSSSSSTCLPSGCYWVNRAVQEKRACAMDRAGAEQLWLDSAKYVGLTLQEQEPAAQQKEASNSKQ